MITMGLGDETTLTFVFAICFSKLIVVINALTCLSCPSAILPTTCATVEKCGPHEVCNIEMYLNHMGSIRFNLGCRDKQQCSGATFGRKRNLKTVAGKQVLNPYDSEFSDTTSVVCSECCAENMCNSAGCHKQGYVGRAHRGPICYVCADQSKADDCDSIRMCSTDEVCMLKAKESTIGEVAEYETMCERKNTCEKIYNTYMMMTPEPAVLQAVIGKRYSHGVTLDDSCKIQCCDDDICNDGINCTAPQSMTSQSTHAHSSMTATTANPTASPTTTDSPVTTSSVSTQVTSAPTTVSLTPLVQSTTAVITDIPSSTPSSPTTTGLPAPTPQSSLSSSSTSEASTSPSTVASPSPSTTSSSPPSTTSTIAVTTTPVSITATTTQEAQFTSSILGTISDGHINAVGITTIPSHPFLIYVLNDNTAGGGPPPGHGPGQAASPVTISVVSTTGGKVANFEILGADQAHWEDISSGPCPGPDLSHLCIFVLGNSADPHHGKEVFYFPVPDHIIDERIDIPHDHHIPLDIPENVGAMFVDPKGDIYLICSNHQLVKIPHNHIGNPHSGVEHLGLVNMVGTPVAADMSSDGKHILIKTTTNVYYWNTGGATDYASVLTQPPTTVSAYKPEPDGQSIAWDNQGHTFYTLSKGHSQHLYQYS